MQRRRNNASGGAQLHRADDARGEGQALIRDRIRELRRVPARELKQNPRNWRKHPPNQRAALQVLLREIGYANALLARELPDGSLELIDGHMRAETTPDAIVPVLILDVDEKEAGKILSTLDPLSSMAEADNAALQALIAETGDLLNFGDMDFSALTKLEEAAEVEIGEPSRTPGDPRQNVKVVLALTDVATLERALSATGNVNRAEALIEICQQYLAANA